MIHLRLGSMGGGPRKTGRRIKHKQHQANRLRSQANRMDRQIYKLLKHKQHLLRLAAQLDEQCAEEEVEITTTTDLVKFGFGRAADE